MVDEQIQSYRISFELTKLVIDRYWFFRTDTDNLFVYVPDNRYAEPIFIYCYTCVFDMITTPLNWTNHFIYNNHSLLA